MRGGCLESKFANPTGLLKNNHIDDWPHLAELVNFFSENNWHDWLFRGITKQDYSLKPAIGREDYRKVKPGGPSGRMPYSEGDEIAAFNMFVDASRPYIGREPSDIEWLAIAQHHGLPTRLLDWTEGLLTAVWFALQKVESTVEFDLSTRKKTVTPINPAVWAIRGVKALSLEEKKNPFKVVEPRSYRPPHISPRISAQRSVFTIHGDPTKEFKVPEMWKFTISAKRSFRLKKRIDACGVNERTLFPDLAGVAKDIGWRYKNNWLAGYRSQ
jgi:hypothetical protein